MNPGRFLVLLSVALQASCTATKSEITVTLPGSRDEVQSKATKAFADESVAIAPECTRGDTISSRAHIGDNKGVTVGSAASVFHAVIEPDSLPGRQVVKLFAEKDIRHGSGAFGAVATGGCFTDGGTRVTSKGSGGGKQWQLLQRIAERLQ
jgi:hypothetical protein